MKNQTKNKLQKIAVVAMAGIFPGACNTGEFFDNIINKRNCIDTIPPHRWPGPHENFISSDIQPDKALGNKAGIIKDFRFDPDDFLIDKSLVGSLDMTHKLVLQAGRQAFSLCSHTEETRARTGVILASIALPTDSSSMMSWQIICRGQDFKPGPEDFLKACALSAPAAVLARAMGFHAGSFTLDAACASSIFAIKLACEQLQKKKADIMVAGGVARPDSLYTQIGFSQLQALSPSGVCSPFDRKADGLVVGEGAGIIVLKRLEDALACGDTIHAVIAGAATSNDIDGTLVKPASEGQLRAMINAFDLASWTPENIQYMECHGSGTPVGDRIELSSIKGLLDHYSCPDSALSIGSIKSMTGHLLTAAGAAGFIKTVLCMKEKILPPSLNFSEPVPGTCLDDSCVKVQTRVEEWAPRHSGTTRKAGVSAFGFGGTNAHILIEEFRPERSFYQVKQNFTGHQAKNIPCAVIGMAAIAKDCCCLGDFLDIMSGRIRLQPVMPDSRWKKQPESDSDRIEGFYMDQVSVGFNEFHIPPNQMDEILPQHILMLKAAKKALENAKIPPRPSHSNSPRERMGCAIGIEFDYGAADFYLRWKLKDFDETVKDKVSPPLTFNRTLGALGGIVASRIAREFRLGGPCFTLSAGPASGIKTIETGVSSLNNFETDVFLCGCVDLAGDIRQIFLNRAAAGGDFNFVPAEGAAALVLKRLDQAIKDKDRIYGVISGISGSCGSSLPGEPEPDYRLRHGIYLDSLESALAESKTEFSELCIYEKGSCDNSADRRIEDTILKNFMESDTQNESCSVSSVFPVMGNTFAASSMFCVIHAGLRLYTGNGSSDRHKNKACIASMTPDGACAHLILEKYENQAQDYNDTRKKAPEMMNDSPELAVKINPCPVPENILHLIQKRITRADKKHVLCPDPAIIAETAAATGRAHEKFLEFSKGNLMEMEKQLKALAKFAHDPYLKISPADKVMFDRSQCLEFAVGKAGNVLGEKFEIIDTFPVRVRLPDEPLMLVDRIIDIKGEMLSLGPGKIITQHDVKNNAWYLDGGKAPVSISIEAGQADLFLCSYLGIDHIVQGKRSYRLLDAKVTFHRSLPEPCETIEYHIEIDRFLRQADVYLFFFHYKGYINGRLFISMRDGCAGFFTDREVRNSGGIILKKDESMPCRTKQKIPSLAPVERNAFSDEQVDHLRAGNMEKAFGSAFSSIVLGANMRLPGGRMHLIDRVLDFNPSGGRFGLGTIIAEADIHPDDWFLTCHFIDDQVMPGTLMYECCAHALRIFTQRFGWISEKDEVFYDVLLNNESDLKCRGPVTPDTRKARYEIEIKKMGYDPEPFVIADAHMFSDDLRIVLYKNMGMKIIGLTKDELESFWRKK